MSAPRFYPYGYCGRSDSCNWCGLPLKHAPIMRLNPEYEVALDKWRRNEGPSPFGHVKMTITSGRKRLGGKFSDGLFCGLRCSYQWAIAKIRKEKTA